MLNALTKSILCSVSDVMNSCDFDLKVNLPLWTTIKFKTKCVTVILAPSYLEDC